MNIEEIKQECIKIDLDNVESGDKSIGIFVDKKFHRFRDKHDIELFYASISLKDLLKIYSQYMGLEDYKKENLESYHNSYSLDILSLIELI